MTESPFTLRRGEARDLDAMYALDVVCFPPPFRFSRRAMRRFATQPGAHVTIGEAGETFAGFCIVQEEVESGELLGYVVTLDVAPAWRGQGLARALMAAADAELLGAGGVAMVLHVFAGNTAARQLYESLGFERMGSERAFYGAGLDAWLYRKWLHRKWL